MVNWLRRPSFDHRIIPRLTYVNKGSTFFLAGNHGVQALPGARDWGSVVGSLSSSLLLCVIVHGGDCVGGRWLGTAVNAFDA
jgi:hypothetical protein